MTERHRADDLIAQLEALPPEELRRQIEAVDRYLRSDAGRAEFGDLVAFARRGGDGAMKLQQTSGSLFENVNMSGATFVNVNLSGASIDDANMSGWRVSNANLSGLRVTKANLAGVSISACRLDGMTIDGVAITEMMIAYQAAQERGESA